MSDMSDLLDNLVNRVRRLEQGLTNPSIVGQYPSTGMDVADITINSIPFGQFSAPDVVQNVVPISHSFFDEIWEDITWDPPATGSVDHYQILVAKKLDATTYDTPDSYFTSAALPSIRIPSLLANQTYGLRINAIAPDSTYGATFPSSTTWQDFLTVADTTAPATPTGLAVTASISSLLVTWNDNTEQDVANGVGRYEVQIDSNPGFVTVDFKDVYVNGTVTTFVGLTPGTTYYVRIRALDTSLNASPWSTVLTAVPGAASSATDGSPPATATAPTVYGLLGSLFAKWDPVTNHDPVTYEVHVATSSAFTPSAGTLASITDATAVTIKDIGGSPLVPGTTYYVKVVAKDADGAAAPSAASSGVSTVQVGTADIAVGAITAASGIIGSLDAATITVGTLSASRIASGTITAEKLSIGTIGAGLAPNPSFEDSLNGATGTPAGWTATTVSAGGSFSRFVDATRATQGQAMLALRANTSGDSAGALSSGIPAAPGQTYYVKCTYGANTSSTTGVFIGITWYKADAVTVIQTDYIVNNGGVVGGTTNNSVSEGQLVAPALTGYAVLAVFNYLPTTANTLYIDSLDMRPVQVSASIGDNAIVASKIQAGAIDTTKITAVGLDAATIKFGTMSGDRISANTLDVNALKTSTLTATTITMGTSSKFLMGTSGGPSVEMSPTGIVAFAPPISVAGDNQTFKMNAADGSITMSGTLQVPSKAVYALNAYPGQTTIDQDGVRQTVRASYNVASQPGPDAVAGLLPPAQSFLPTMNGVTVTGGTFKILFGNVASAAIAFNASYATVATAINGLAPVSAAGITFTVDSPNGQSGAAGFGANGTSTGYRFTANKNRKLPLISLDVSLLTPTPSFTYEQGAPEADSFSTNSPSNYPPIGSTLGLDPIETTDVNTVVSEVVESGIVATQSGTAPSVYFSRLYNNKGVRYGNASTVAGRIRIPLTCALIGVDLARQWTSGSNANTFYLTPGAVYVLSFHILDENSAGTAPGSAYLDANAVKVLQRNFGNTTTATVTTGLDGVAVNITPALSISGPGRLPTLVRYSSRSTAKLWLGGTGQVTGGPSGTNQDVGFKRFFVAFTAPSGMADLDHLMLELPTPVTAAGAVSTDTFFVNGIDLEPASAGGAPTRFFDWTENGVVQGNYGGASRIEVGELSVPTFAESQALGRFNADRLRAQTLKVGDRHLDSPAAEINGKLKVRGNASLSFPHGDWQYGRERFYPSYVGMTQDVSRRGYYSKLLNQYPSWTSYDGFAYGPFRYRKSSGFVYPSGLSAGNAVNDCLVQVPADCCPDFREVLMCSTANTPFSSRVDVFPSGEVQLILINGGASPALVSMDSLQWVAAADVPSSAWTYVGDPGAPAFANSWVNYQNRAPGTVTYAPARFYMDDSGYVHLSGLIKLGASGVAIFTLPAAYCPDTALTFMTICSGGLARITVNPAGTVYVAAYGTGANNAFVSISGISFMNGSGATTPYGAPSVNDFLVAATPSYLNSWTRYSASYAPLRLYRDVDGMVHLEGLVTGGVANTALCRPIPTYMRPTFTILLQLASNAAFTGRLEVRPDGNIVAVDFGGGTNAFIGVCGNSWFPDT